MPTFPSFEYAQALQAKCNGLATFKRSAEWSDVNVVLAFGDQRYWMKLYRGQIIDLMEYLPATNAFGYDVIVSGDHDAWRELMAGTAKSWALLTTGRLVIDGNLLEANRIHEALCLIVESLADVPEEVSNVA